MTPYIIAYILLGIAQAARNSRDNANGYSVEYVLMTAFHGLFWPASILAEAVLAAVNACVTWYLWPRDERWARLKLAAKTKLRRDAP